MVWIRSPPAVCVNHRAIITHVNVSRALRLKGCRAVAPHIYIKLEVNDKRWLLLISQRGRGLNGTVCLAGHLNHIAMHFFKSIDGDERFY